MITDKQPGIGLSGNQLKLLALVFMTLDHIGLSLLPQYPLFRILGRLSLPIFAYMIAEGCRYTRNRMRYLLSTTGLALVCQLVYFFAMGSLYQCILVTFSLSIILIYALDWAFTQNKTAAWLALTTGFAGITFAAVVLPGLLSNTDYAIDYGIWGILLPVWIYLGKTKTQAFLLCAMGLILLATNSSPTQWYSLLALPLLALYTGKRGKYNMKYLFYIYYPAHLVIIYLCTLLL